MTTPAPTRLADRIATLDVLRGVAICGILLMNIPEMGGRWDNGGPALPAAWDADWITWGLQTVLAEGTMRGLFTMLFGAGMLLMLRRAEGPAAEVAPIDVWVRRCIALMVLGIVQFAVFFWPGEILFNYGLAGLLLLAFRTARPRTLLSVAAGLLALLSLNNANGTYAQVRLMQDSPAALAAKRAGKAVSATQQAAIDAATEARKSVHPPAAVIAEEWRTRTAFPSLLAWSWEKWGLYNYSGLDWVRAVGESLGFMLIGMALFRTGILTGQASTRGYALLMLLGYGIGLAWRAYGVWHQSLTAFDFDMTRLNPAYGALRAFAYEPARLLVTLGHLGLIVTLFRSGRLGAAAPLRALGRMALSVYSLQSILTSILFYAMGWVLRFGFATLMAIAVAIWVVTGLFSLWWLRRHEMGPMELLLRGATYGTFRKRRAEAAATLAAASAL